MTAAMVLAGETAEETRRVAFAGLVGLAGILGLPLPARLIVAASGDDVEAAARTIRAHGIACAITDDGLEIDAGGAVYELTRDIDSAVRREAAARGERA